jgi:hypothetical protein
LKKPKIVRVVVAFSRGSQSENILGVLEKGLVEPRTFFSEDRQFISLHPDFPTCPLNLHLPDSKDHENVLPHFNSSSRGHWVVL